MISLERTTKQTQGQEPKGASTSHALDFTCVPYNWSHCVYQMVDQTCGKDH